MSTEQVCILLSFVGRPAPDLDLFLMLPDATAGSSVRVQTGIHFLSGCRKARTNSRPATSVSERAASSPASTEKLKKIHKVAVALRDQHDRATLYKPNLDKPVQKLDELHGLAETGPNLVAVAGCSEGFKFTACC